MRHTPESHAWLNEGARFVERFDKMVRAGRITEEDAERLRAAAKSGELKVAAREIQLRHARAKVSAAVKDGRLAQEEADAIFDRLEKGEDPRFLLRGLRRRIAADG